LGFQFNIEFNRGETLAFRTDWIRKMRLNPSKLVSMRVYGDSMEERLHDGDAVVIDTSQIEVLDGKVYALWYDGGERVKRLYRMPGGGLSSAATTRRNTRRSRSPPTRRRACASSAASSTSRRGRPIAKT
jgi:hypothetical protein